MAIRVRIVTGTLNCILFSSYIIIVSDKNHNFEIKYSNNYIKCECEIMRKA